MLGIYLMREAIFNLSINLLLSSVLSTFPSVSIRLSEFHDPYYVEYLRTCPSASKSP